MWDGINYETMTADKDGMVRIPINKPLAPTFGDLIGNKNVDEHGQIVPFAKELLGPPSTYTDVQLDDTYDNLELLRRKIES